MKLLWLTWKDRKHPRAGGAEVVNEELAKRLVADGNQVTFVVGGWKGAPSEEIHKDGYQIIRLGNRYSVYWYAYRYYKEHLVGWADLVIDEVNTMPFFAKYYVKEPNILFAHMLCRRIWFYEMPQPLSIVGYMLESIYLRLLNNKKVITVSNSTKKDLMRMGFKADGIHIISEGVTIPPVTRLSAINTMTQPTLLSFGSIRPMKRTLHQIKAFELAKKQLPELHMIIAGDSSSRYGQKVMRAIQTSPYCEHITYHGKVPAKARLNLMRQSHALLQTSVKEGWGLTVTEAASQGTPSVVYDTDGLRDSVRNNETGLVVEHNTPRHLADKIIELFNNQEHYQLMRQAAWQWSHDINFQKSYEQFNEAISV